MWVFPLAAAAIALVFAVLSGRQFVERRRPFQALWAIALIMYAVASFAMFLGVLDGWSAGEFRLYWLFGAILNVPYLAQGEVHLLFRRGWVVSGLLGLLVVATFVAAWVVLAAPVDEAALATRALPLGKEVFGSSAAAYRLAQVYAYPAFLFLLGGSVWSAIRMRGRPELRDRSIGTILVAVGATIVAMGSGVGAGLDIAWLFAVSLAAGIAVMFWGFLRASRPAGPSPEPQGSQG